MNGDGIITAYYSCPFGRLTSAVDERTGGVTQLLPEYLPDVTSNLRDESQAYCEVSHTALQTLFRWLDEYFAGHRPDPCDLPLSPAGTAFQHAVWDILLTIPYGETFSYGKIAKMIADERGIVRMSAQAVGGAVRRNPIAIVIPCHRVIGADGSLVGFGGGTEMLPVKRWLLTHENAAGWHENRIKKTKIKTGEGGAL